MPDRSCRPDRVAIDRVADEYGARLDDLRHAQEKIGRCAIVDRHQDYPLEQAPPERNDPLGAILCPDRDRVPLANP